MFKVFPWIFRMKTRTNLYFLRNDCEAGARQMHSDLYYFLGLSPVNWKWYLPSVNLSPPHGGPGAIHLLVSAGTHQSIWRLTYCLVPGWFGNAGHLGSVCKWCDSSCGMPRDWETLAVLTSGKEEQGKRREMFSYTVQPWRDSSIKEHTAFWLSPLWTDTIEGKLVCVFFFFNFILFTIASELW